MTTPKTENATTGTLQRLAVIAGKAVVILVLFVILVAVASSGSNDTADTEVSSSTSSATTWLEGSWVLAPTGGEDGGTACSDFNARVLYQQNRNTGKVISFYPGGIYREMFAYSTPSGNEHSTMTKARWQQNGNRVSVTDVTMKDAFTGAGQPYTLTVEQDGDNVIVVRSDGQPSRFVRCQDDPAAIYGE